MSETKESGFWAIVEIMGHKRYAGLVSEQVVGGASFIRIDVPLTDQLGFTKLFGSQAIYGITPVTKEAALGAAYKLREQPMSEWDLPDEWRQAISQGQLSYDGDDDADSSPI